MAAAADAGGEGGAERGCRVRRRAPSISPPKPTTAMATRTLPRATSWKRPWTKRVRFEEAAGDSESTDEADERVNAARDAGLGPDDSRSEGPDATDSAATKTDPDAQ